MLNTPANLCCTTVAVCHYTNDNADGSSLAPVTNWLAHKTSGSCRHRCWSCNRAGHAAAGAAPCQLAPAVAAACCPCAPALSPPAQLTWEPANCITGFSRQALNLVLSCCLQTTHAVCLWSQPEASCFGTYIKFDYEGEQEQRDLDWPCSATNARPPPCLVQVLLWKLSAC